MAMPLTWPDLTWAGGQLVLCEAEVTTQADQAVIEQVKFRAL